MKINIVYNSAMDTAKILSNLANTPFCLDGITYGSVEAFWKSLYVRENREIHYLKYGLDAWRVFNNKPYPENVLYHGELYRVGSESHQNLMKRAIIQKAKNNADVRRAFIKTQKYKYIHEVRNNKGIRLPDSLNMPPNIFCQILEEIKLTIVNNEL